MFRELPDVWTYAGAVVIFIAAYDVLMRAAKITIGVQENALKGIIWMVYGDRRILVKCGIGQAFISRNRTLLKWCFGVRYLQ